MTRSENYILDFTHIYMNKNIEKESNLLHIDCSDISGSDLYCTKEAEKKIKQRIDEHGIHGIHFIDSGNYHYITKFMTDKIQKKFSLVLYDHHTDMQESMIEGMTSCGDWAGQVLEQNENLVQLILVGAKEKDIKQLHLKNQGHMSLRMLKDLLKFFLKDKKIIGVDLCGECPKGLPFPEYVEIEEKNESTNLELYEYIEKF